MKVVDTGIEGLVLLEPRIFEDDRGYFFESFNSKVFEGLGLPQRFVQDNVSRSKKNVLRGLHFQNPQAQGKLVRVTLGSVWDVAVDIRPDSQTFGQYFGVELSAENKKLFYIPEGFAHGFCVLSDWADFHYKCTALYAPQFDHGLVWNDPDLKIDWPVKEPVLSKKDQSLKTLSEYKKAHKL